ncbi:hypothetical protein HK096_005626 [Nowakowskiella sp. JEL0078]|nr:hypothetical protein HK096_005626 [Nowakowskiella sp. JEL0078]
MGVIEEIKRRMAVADIHESQQNRTYSVDPLEREGFLKIQQYKFKKPLGQGASAEVKLATHLPTNQNFAIKCINKSILPGYSGAKARGKVLREMTILNGLEHDNLIKVFDTFQDDKHFYLVLEVALGGTLLERFPTSRFPEKLAVSVIYQLLDAVAYLHDRNIVHRDLKPENVLFKSKASDSPIVIMDFGVADVVKGNDLLHSPVVGTPRFSSPEVLNLRGHGRPADIWSIGCIAYTVLVGFNPFRTAADLKQMKEFAEIGPQFPSKNWYDISPVALDLVRRCLTVNPVERITARQAKMHPWFVQNIPAAREYARATLKKVDEARLKNNIPTQTSSPIPITISIITQQDQMVDVLEEQTQFKTGFENIETLTATQAC